MGLITNLLEETPFNRIKNEFEMMNWQRSWGHIWGVSRLVRPGRRMMTRMSHQDLTGSSTHVLEVGAFLKIESLLGRLAQIVACPHQQMLSKILSSKRSCWNFHDIWDSNAKNRFFWGHYLCHKSVFSIPAIKSSVFRGLKTKDWGLQPIPTTSD